MEQGDKTKIDHDCWDLWNKAMKEYKEKNGIVEKPYVKKGHEITFVTDPHDYWDRCLIKKDKKRHPNFPIILQEILCATDQKDEDRKLYYMCKNQTIRCQTKSLCAAVVWSEAKNIMSLSEFSKKSGVSEITIAKIYKKLN